MQISAGKREGGRDDKEKEQEVMLSGLGTKISGRLSSERLSASAWGGDVSSTENENA